MIADFTMALGGMLAKTGDLADQLEGAFTLIIVMYIALIVLMTASWWVLFTKAGQPGWASIIPIYNMYIMFKMIDKPGVWVVYMLIPIVNIICAITLCSQLAKVFGRGAGTAIGLFFLGFIFVPILAFGSAKYGGRTPATPPPAPVA